MTTAQHATGFLTAASDIASESSQPSFLDHSNRSKTTPTVDSLNATVASVVDDIVDAAVSTASIQAEKRNVQALINKLVSQVREDAVKAKKDHSVTPESVMASEKQRLFGGVAIGDHRQRKCRELPVTWTQTMDSVTLSVDVPPWVRKQQVSVKFTSGSIRAAVVDNSSSVRTVLFDEPFVAEIAVDGCMWALEEEGSFRKLIIEIEKARMQWWARLFMSDDPTEYTIVNPRNRSGLTDMSSSDALLQGDSEATSGDSMPGPRTETATNRQAETEVDLDKSSASNLEDSVAAFVDDVIDVAASESPDSNQPPSKSCEEEGINKQSKLQQQRVLTRADIPKMVEQCKKVIATGGARASESALQLATFYHHGLGVEQNDAEAARLYKYALENGILDPSAAFQLGLIYNQGAPGLEPNAAEAVRWWRVSASLRNPVAMFNLGVMYMNGSGCDMDPIMATRWFQQAQALDPRLQPPQFSRAQLEDRIATAMKLKKQRLKRALPPEEKQRRKELALQKVRMLAYGSAAIVGLGVSVVALRYWWRNRL